MFLGGSLTQIADRAVLGWRSVRWLHRLRGRGGLLCITLNHLFLHRCPAELRIIFAIGLWSSKFRALFRRRRGFLLGPIWALRAGALRIAVAARRGSDHRKCNMRQFGRNVWYYGLWFNLCWSRFHRFFKSWANLGMQIP